MPPSRGAAAEANGTDVFDLTAAAAAATGEAAPFAFSYKGELYELPPQTSWPVSALASLGKGDLEEALPQILGEAGCARLLDAGLTVGEMNTLMDAAAKAAGLDGLPNSPTSARRGSAPT